MLSGCGFVKRHSELGMVHRLKLLAARQVAWDLLLLGMPRGAKKPAGAIRKSLVRGRVWLCYLILNAGRE